MTKSDWISMFQNVAKIMLLCVFINALLNIKVIMNFFLNSNGHPLYSFIFSGGPNIEVTWISMFAVFFKNNKKKPYLYILLCVILSVLLASRVGIIINVMAFMYFFMDSKHKNNIIVIVVILLIIMMLLFVLQNGNSRSINYLIERFTSIGTKSDLGTTGRLAMWVNVHKAFAKNPFGYGSGNAIKAINIVSNVLVREEGNMHNIYFQMLLDGGLLGIIGYLFIIFRFAFGELKNVFNDSIIGFIYFYLVLGVLQFTGAEAILFFVIGIYCINKYNEGISKHNKQMYRE